MRGRLRTDAERKETEKKQKENDVLMASRMASRMVVIEPTDAALAAKQRKRGPSVLERLRAEEDAAMQSSCGRAKRAKVATALADSAPLEVSGGKSRKTGMALARAELAESPSGVGAAREQQAALVGKQYRKAEGIARETAVGMLATKEMPRRKESTESAQQFQQNFFSWMRGSLTGKARASIEKQLRMHVVERALCAVQVKQVRTSAAYEKMVLTVNEWIVEQGFEAFCHVVERKSDTDGVRNEKMRNVLRK